MKKQLKRQQHSEVKKRYHFHWWIIACGSITLLVLMMGFLVFHQTKTQRHALTTATNTSVSGTAINVKFNQKQLASILNYAVKKASSGSVNYKFVVGNYVTIVGTTKILGAKVSFSLQTTPEVTKNGNILLKAKSVNVGSLNVPLSYILKYVKSSYNLPSGFSINAKKKTILLNLKQLLKKQDISLKAIKINNSTHEYYFKIGLPN